jgi:hypothetical protein
MKKYVILSFSFLTILFVIKCSVFNTITDISRLQFKVGAANSFQINGISFSDKSKINDFSAIDVLKLSSAFIKGSLPASFTLNVEAKNPNDGSGGYQKTDATIQNLKWRLFINDKETIAGELDQPVHVPGTGEITTIPVKINIDLMKFFKDQGYENIINLALALGGNQRSSSKISLYVIPTVTSPFGNITYPGELKIVDYTFTRS